MKNLMREFESLQSEHRWAFGGLLVVVCIVAFLITLAVITRGAIFEGGKITINRIPNYARDCSKGVNVDTPYCREHAASIERNWKNISKYGGDPTPPFQINGR